MAITLWGKGYVLSLWLRKMIDVVWGWFKTIGGLCMMRNKGLLKLLGQTLLHFAAYNQTLMMSIFGAKMPDN